MGILFRQMAFLTLCIVMVSCSSNGSTSSSPAGEAGDGVTDTREVGLRSNWYFFGDSQTAGQGVEDTQPLSRSHAVAFENLWLSNFEAVPYTYTYGIGGRSLQGTMQAYESTNSYLSDDWVHIQESGSQDHDGQRTPAEFVSTFEAFVGEILSRSPNALITMETAYSFEREATEWRDWASYNVALRAKVVEMQANGLRVYLIDVEPVMQNLVTALGFDTVILSDGGHYSGIGNLCISLLMYYELGYDVNQLNLDGVSDVLDSHKAQCLSVINQL